MNKTQLIEQAIREIINLLENLLSYILTPEGDEEDEGNSNTHSNNSSCRACSCSKLQNDCKRGTEKDASDTSDKKRMEGTEHISVEGGDKNV